MSHWNQTLGLFGPQNRTEHMLLSLNHTHSHFTTLSLNTKLVWISQRGEGAGTLDLTSTEGAPGTLGSALTSSFTLRLLL